MKNSVVLLALAFALPARAQQGGAKPSEVRKLLDMTGVAKMSEQVVSQMMGQFKQMMPQVPEQFWTDFAKEAKPEDLISLEIPIYAKYLTSEDVQALIRFYESPTGKKFVSVQPMITQESMKIGQEWGRKLGERVMQKLNDQKKK
jgi:hypothetical protein